MTLARRIRSSLKLRILLTTLAREVQDSVLRFQRERMLTVRNWAEAEAMQLTLDTGDAKFAEDHFRKTIQDQGGAIEAVALLNLEQRIVALVRHAEGGAVRGEGMAALRGTVIDLPALRTGAKEDEISVR